MIFKRTKRNYFNIVSKFVSSQASSHTDFVFSLLKYLFALGLSKQNVNLSTEKYLILGTFHNHAILLICMFHYIMAFSGQETYSVLLLKTSIEKQINIF